MYQYKKPIRTRKQPENLVQLGIECLRSPSQLGDIAMSGVSNTRMLWQLIIGYGLALILAGFTAGVAAAGTLNLEMDGFAEGVIFLLANTLGLTLAFWLLGAVLRSGATFLGLLTGVAFLQLLLAAVLFLAALLFQWPVVILPEGAASTLAAIHWIVEFIAIWTLYISFVMGAFDVGCGAAIGLAFAVNILSLLLQGAVFGLLAGAF